MGKIEQVLRLAKLRNGRGDGGQRNSARGQSRPHARRRNTRTLNTGHSGTPTASERPHSVTGSVRQRRPQRDPLEDYDKDDEIPSHLLQGGREEDNGDPCYQSAKARRIMPESRVSREQPVEPQAPSYVGMMSPSASSQGMLHNQCRATPQREYITAPEEIGVNTPNPEDRRRDRHGMQEARAWRRDPEPEVPTNFPTPSFSSSPFFVAESGLTARVPVSRGDEFIQRSIGVSTPSTPNPRIRNTATTVQQSASVQQHEHTNSNTQQQTTANEECTIRNKAHTLEEKLVQLKSLKSSADEECSRVYLCPLSQDIMVDPVIAHDGWTYERAKIEEWFNRNNTSPMTLETLESLNLISNRALRSSIYEWVEEQLRPFGL